MPNDFFTGLIGGLGRSLYENAQKRSDDEIRTQQQETNILNHLAQTSDDPEVRALALSGLMEMTQGKKRGGFLGLGKLKSTESFQKLMELGHRAGIMGGGGGAGGGAMGGPPGAGGAPPPLGQEVDEAGQPLVGPPGQVVNRQVGTPSPLEGLVSGGGGAPQSSAALPATSPTTGGPPAGPDELVTAGRPDVLGTRGPVGTRDALSIISGRETAKQAATFEAQRRLEAQRQGGREALADTKAAEQRGRDEANWEHRDQQLATRMTAMGERTDKIIEAAMTRLNTSISARDRQREETDMRMAKQRLSDELGKINARRVKLHTQTMTPKEQAAALDDLETSFDDAYKSFYREIGVERPKLGEEGKPAAAAAPAAAPKPAAAPAALPSVSPTGTPNVDALRAGPPAQGGPPAAPAPQPSIPTPPAGGSAAGGPPGPPLALEQVPNGAQIKSQAEALRRQKKTPQEILQLAAPHLNPLQLQALKTYLRL